MRNRAFLYLLLISLSLFSFKKEGNHISRLPSARTVNVSRESSGNTVPSDVGCGVLNQRAALERNLRFDREGMLVHSSQVLRITTDGCDSTVTRSGLLRRANLSCDVVCEASSEAVTVGDESEALQTAPLGCSARIVGVVGASL